MLTFAGGAGASAWRVELRHPGEGLLKAIACASPASCTAVGIAPPTGGSARLDAFALRERGRGWRRTGGLWAGASTACASGTCVIVGGGPFGLAAERSTRSGWARTAIDGPPVLYGDFLTGVSCASPRFCVAVGTATASTTVDCPPDPVIPYCITSVPLVETSHGGGWEQVQVPAPALAVESLPRTGFGPYVELDAVSCPAVDNCTAVGDWGFNPAPTKGWLFSEHWDGRRWALAPIATPGALTHPVLQSISCGSAATCVAAGSYENAAGIVRPLIERYAAGMWSVDPVRGVSRRQPARFTSVSCVGSACLAVGASGASSSRLFAARVAGASTVSVPVSSPSGQRLPGASFSGVACVLGGACLATADIQRGGWLILRYRASRPGQADASTVR